MYWKCFLLIMLEVHFCLDNKGKQWFWHWWNVMLILLARYWTTTDIHCQFLEIFCLQLILQTWMFAKMGRLCATAAWHLTCFMYLGLGIFSSRSSLLSSSGFGSFWHYLRGYACMTDYLEIWSWQIWNIKLENSHWAQCNLIPFQEFELLCMIKSCVDNCPILVQGFATFGFHILLWE
jgi:hypothetical protein